MQYAELETILGDIDRSRAVYELAISQPRLDMPEVLWKSFIDFEVEQEEWDNARALYRRLLERTQHVKVIKLKTVLDVRRLNMTNSYEYLMCAVPLSTKAIMIFVSVHPKCNMALVIFVTVS